MVREYDYDGWGRLRRLYLTRDGQKRLFLDVDGYTDSHLMRGYELPEYGVKREYSYNAQNDRITGIKDVAGEQLIVQDAYGYDGVGNRTNRTLTRPNTRIPETQMVGVFAGSVTGGDDHPGHDPGSPGSSPTFVTNTTYEYDKLDRLISFIQENSDGVSFGKEYEYDKSGNMERDRWTGLDEYAVVKMRYKNDADQIESQWRTFQKGDGGWLDYEYDQHGSLTSITGRDSANTFMTHTYAWDARNRLVKATTSGVGGNSDSESLYDKDGLRYKHVVTRHSAQNSHSGLDPESSQDGHSAPDAEQRSEGDVEETVSRYFYEDGGRLIAEQVGDTLYTYVHLGAHPVVRFNETRAGSESSLSAYHSQNGVLTDGNQLRDHSSEGLDMNDSDPARHNMGEDVIPASEVESPGSSTITTLLYHRDSLGTTLATSFYDADLQQWKINPIDTLPYGQEASFHHAGTGASTFEFTGKKRDGATNLNYFHARYYDSLTGRFLSYDPAGIDVYEPKTINRYQYVYGSPPNNVDPDGREVYAVARPLNSGGLGSLGRHQFSVLIPDNPDYFPNMVDLGGGKQGYVMGAYNIDGELTAYLNAPSDLDAIRTHFNSPNQSKLQLSRVNHPGKSDSELITDIFQGASNFNKNSLMEPISYPTLEQQLWGSNPNSNSFNQSLLKAVGGKDFTQDFWGYDAQHNTTIDGSYFE